MLRFLIGFIIGAYVGIALMCILQVSKESEEK